MTNVFAVFSIKLATPIAFPLTQHKKTGNMEAASYEFIEYMRCKVSQMCPDHVLNMDQMPIPLSFHSNAHGQRKVHILFM